MSAIARLAVSPRLSMAAARSLRPASVQATHWLCCQVHRSRRCHRRSRRVRSRNWLCVRLPDHRLRQEPLPQAAALLLRHSWLRSLRGHGTVLSYDGFPAALRLLSTGCVECRHLAPEERLLFPSYQLLFWSWSDFSVVLCNVGK